MNFRFRPNRNTVISGVVCVLVGTYYLWGARAAGYPFNWDKDEPGYYNYLARGFAAGHLYLPVDPSPQLLAQPNPWDPKVDDSLKLFDAVLYKQRYYLYHGAGPAVLLFAPFRIITHRDLPENFGLFLFCFGGFLFSAGALLALLKRGSVQPGLFLLTAMLLALGLCQSVPFLLSRVWVYELAVAAGYFCLSGAVFCSVRSLLSERLVWLSGSGLLFGLAVACRPHLVIAGAVALLTVALTSSRRRTLALAVPFLLAGICIATYNYQRFGNPVEFGTKWQLAGDNQGRVALSAHNVLPGAYYLLLASPNVSPVFPWVELPWPMREFPRPATYYLEQTAGALYLAPFILFIPLILLTRRNRMVLIALLAADTGIFLFVAMTGWSTQRYEVDFLPLLLLIALGSFPEALTSFPRVWRSLLRGALFASIAAGCIVNMALGIAGPYWEMIKNKPHRFVRIAGWFSPVERHRPVVNPRFDLRFTARAAGGPDHVREEWVTAARFPYHYELYLERVSGKPRLFSSYAGSQVIKDLEQDAAPASYRVTYSPAGELQVTRNGTEILRHNLGLFVSAPSQVVVRARPL